MYTSTRSATSFSDGVSAFGVHQMSDARVKCLMMGRADRRKTRPAIVSMRILDRSISLHLPNSMVHLK